MTHRTMRDFLGALDKRGLLRRIAKPVDPSWEPAALAKWMFQALPDEKRFGMMFENVQGSSVPLVIGALGAGTAAYALALDVDPADINAAWVRASRNPIAPARVERALCQEHVRLGRDADLSWLPIPVWTPGKDAGPYVTANTVTKNCDSGIQNTGIYRTLVRDSRSLVCNLSPGRQGSVNVATWHAKGKPAPVAWVIAPPPAVQLATVANLPAGVDEMTLAGGMLGRPVDMVPCKTIDLMVPADAEIVIEAEFLPGELETEGPFGEFAGYMGAAAQRPLARITAITHRDQPIYYGFSSQMPPSESTVIQSLTNAGVLLKSLRYDLNEPGVSDVFIDLTFGGLLAHAIVAMKPRYPAHGKKVGRLIAAMSPYKRITIVDDDVDIRDHAHVEWAMNSHFNPARDTVLIDDVFFSKQIDPSLVSNVSSSIMGSKMVCDATLKSDAGTYSLPPREMMMKALDTWRELGLPEFEIPRRAQLRIDKS